MDTAIITGCFALAGASIGACATLLVTRVNGRQASSREEAAFNRHRVQIGRDLAAEAFAPSVEAVGWLHADHVEDCVIEGPLREEFEPGYVANVEKLREARRKLLHAANVENAIERYYEWFQLDVDVVTDLRQVLHAESRAMRQESEREARELNERLRTLKDQQAKLLRAHYANALPIDLLKTEQERLGTTDLGG